MDALRNFKERMMQVDTKDSAAQPEASTPAPQTFFLHESKQPRPLHRAILENLFYLQGRFSRETFWAIYVGSFAAALVGSAILTFLLPFLVPVYAAVLTWVAMATTAKRFHDRDKTGWWVLVSFIPFFGTIWILLECGLLEGDAGPNRFGQRAMAPREVLQ